MAGQNLIRIAAAALALSTLSFAAGVAGDLSIIDPPRTGQRVVLRIPPELPTDTVRAWPLLSTASVEARSLARVRARVDGPRPSAIPVAAAPDAKPRQDRLHVEAKPLLAPAPKADERKGA